MYTGYIMRCTEYILCYLQDICTKTVLCGHEHMSKAFNSTIKSDYNCYKLFGFDVFIDEDFKPWIIEVKSN